MLKQAAKDLNIGNGFYIRYRLNGSLFNLQQLQAHTKNFEQLIRDFCSADDASFDAPQK